MQQRNGNKLWQQIQLRILVIHRYRCIIYAIILTIIFIHSYIILHNTITSHAILYQTFLSGTNHGHNSTNLDISWPGWQYYFSDNYYGQTLSRLEQSRAKLMQLIDYQHMLAKLKDLHNGIYSTRSWLTNHRLGYAMLAIGWRSLGVLALAFVWVTGVIGGVSRGRGKCGVFCRVMLIGLIWSVVPIFGFLSMFLRSILVLNNHPICQPMLNSGVIQILINSNSATTISQYNLNLV